MATMTESAASAVKEYTQPLRAAVEANIRDVRRAVVAGRHAAEDAAAEATLHVRRHPLVSVGAAAAIGTVFGCLVGFAVGRYGGARRSE
jgi:ElaB/YqjD/DUF883 family membrane-anchored ribosome-binding protein